MTFPILKILQVSQSRYNLPTVCVNTSDYSMLFKEFFLFVDSGSPPSWILPTPTACRWVGCFAYSRDIGGLETNPSLYERPVILHPPSVPRISHSVQYSKVGHCLAESVEMYTKRVRPIKNTGGHFNENIYFENTTRNLRPNGRKFAANSSSRPKFDLKPSHADEAALVQLFPPSASAALHQRLYQSTSAQ